MTNSSIVFSIGVFPSTRWMYSRSMLSTPNLCRLRSHCCRQYAGELSMSKPMLPSSRVPILRPNLVARKMSARRSGWRANHLPTRSSLSPYMSAESQLVQPSSQARSRTARRSSSELFGSVSEASHPWKESKRRT